MTVSSSLPAAEESRTGNNMSLTYAEFISPVDALDVQYQQGSYSASYLSEANYISSNLPQEFQVIEETPVPLMQNTEDTDHDFIVIAEFSESEGPVPLCTIPFNAPSKTDINLSSLAVHLMSTDYQVNTVGHFKICRDTQVMRKNIFRNVHVFMQYFTLYDIKARGFVRPFCFGYVSKDHIKLNKLINVLISEFDRYSKILKQANRKWFANELSQYLDKLSSAKDNFLQDFIPKHEDRDPDIFSFEVGEGQEDPDAITLNQIAHQYSEIENILRIVKNAENDSTLDSEIEEVCKLLDSNPDAPIVTKLLDKMKIPISPHALANNFSGTMDIPLLHPLKIKGESLRPLTTLGQLGTVVLIWKLMAVHKQCSRDIIFTEMDALTSDFRKSCKLNIQNANFNPELSKPDINSISDLQNSSPSHYSNVVEEKENCEKSGIVNSKEEVYTSSLFTEELCKIVDKLHSNIPVVSDNGSGSYHTMSEDDSDLNLPSRESATENESSSYVSAFGSVENCNTAVTDGAINASLSAPKNESRSQKTSISSDSTMQMSRNSVSSFSSDDDMSSENTAVAAALQLSSEEILIKKVPWWESVSEKLVRGRPGYGLLKFFRRYHNVAHHILFSILIGRRIVICSEEKNKSKVTAILTALTPLVPCYPETHWKLLRWHRGILVQTHIRKYKLIGLCIPERLSVLDLLNPKDQNYVTIFNIDKKNLLGPAYQGDFFRNFDNLCHDRFFESDDSLLTYIGSILTEIETKVFMFKTLEGRNISTIFKQLKLRCSDIEIVRCLGNMVADADNSVELF